MAIYSLQGLHVFVLDQHPLRTEAYSEMEDDVTANRRHQHV